MAKQSLGLQVRNFIAEFPDLTYDGTVVRCLICQKPLVKWNTINCRRHVQSARHKYNRRQQFPYWTFIYDVIFMLSVCNISQNVLDNQHFRLFWGKYVPNWSLLTRKQVQRQFPIIKEIIQNELKCHLRDQKLWININETTDAKNNKVGNVLVRTLNDNHVSMPYLIASKRLKQVNSKAIQQLVMRAFLKFGIRKRNVLMLVTGGAAHMLKAGVEIKEMCPNLLHITCLLNSFYLVVETIRSSYPDVDKLIESTRHIFIKSAKRIKQFHKSCPGIAEPPQTVSTKQGMWLKAAFYYHEHFQTVKSAISQFNVKESRYIMESQQQFGNPQIEIDLQALYANYSVLLDAIDRLQENSLSLCESMEIVNNVNLALQNLNDFHGVVIAEKFNDILQNNPDYMQLCFMNECLKNERLGYDVQNYAYASITSLDMQRLFSSYGATLTSEHTRLTEDAIEAILMMQLYAESYTQPIIWTN